MSSWVWILIGIVVVVAVGAIVWQALARRRTGRLQQRFGPEYDRAVSSAETKREGEAELEARAERREHLEIRPLSAESRSRYLESWQAVQAQFVDNPQLAVASADTLIQSAMADCGYPVEDFDQRAADLSVDHPQVVENYREGHRLAEASAKGSDSTEGLRQAMRHYRALFQELLGTGDDDEGVESEARDSRQTAGRMVS